MTCKAFRDLPAGVARATTEHMPFVGHRTQKQVREMTEPRQAWSAERRAKFEAKKLSEYGFDPESLKAAQG